MIRLSKLRILIIDDEKHYFSDIHLETAKNFGFHNIERHFYVDRKFLEKMTNDPPDIIILDIKGITDPLIAKDGCDIAKILYKIEKSYIVITSTHSFLLKSISKCYDYKIDERILTAIDFVDELFRITEDFLQKKTSFYEKIFLKIGIIILKKSVI
jgi:two-component SAPR family response regulator